MEVEIISRENIKPSSQTPHHLKTYKLTLLDQIIPPVYYPVLLYFPADQPNFSADVEFISHRILLLKRSLSLSITRFYPFAGIITDSLSVDCNDEGVPFVVAKVRGCLSNFLDQPDLQRVQSFLPFAFSWDEKAQGSNVLMIQVNVFDCGGLVIAINVSHKVADGITLCTFLKDWGLMAQGSSQEIFPDYMAQSIFPQINSLPDEKHLFSDIKHFLKIAKYVPRRYAFDALAVSTLKAKSTSSAVKSPTRVEVISAFIWKCFMAAKSGSSSTSLLTHAVNLRRKTVPPLSENCFGNFLWIAAAQNSNENETDLRTLVSKIRESISEIDDDFVKNMQSEKGCPGYYENLEKTSQRIPKESGILCFSSWCKFGIYDIDFGWGRPIWASNCVPAYSESLLLNSVTLMDTRSGDGIEALVILDEKYVAAFENNKELLAFASIDPSPMVLGKQALLS
ncbi:vinorine synthase-like [Olea europaea var. sylvestris]|uniref:vinorine synthase-like n=1 Tax=Olea europaea var. sylvestris TaxID=158386 RepID=UPI000C1D1EB8|nr:vinorine synthase-like [Olea europaea var. sylvestris]